MTQRTRKRLYQERLGRKEERKKEYKRCSLARDAEGVQIEMRYLLNKHYEKIYKREKREKRRR